MQGNEKKNISWKNAVLGLWSSLNSWVLERENVKAQEWIFVFLSDYEVHLYGVFGADQVDG